MKRQFAFIFGLFLTLCWATTGLAAPIGSFTKIEGRVDITSPGTRARPAYSGDDVRVGDIVRTKSRAKAEIQFNDGSIMRLASGSRVQINEYMTGKKKRSGIFNLFRGKIQNIVKKYEGLFGFRKENRYEVHTPTAVCGVRGTNYFSSYVRGASNFVFKEGTGYGYTKNRPDQILTIQAGQALTVAGANKPPVVRVATQAEIEQHSQDTKPPENTDNDKEGGQDASDGQTDPQAQPDDNGKQQDSQEQNPDNKDDNGAGEPDGQPDGNQNPDDTDGRHSDKVAEDGSGQHDDQNNLEDRPDGEGNPADQGEYRAENDTEGAPEGRIGSDDGGDMQPENSGLNDGQTPDDQGPEDGNQRYDMAATGQEGEHRDDTGGNYDSGSGEYRGDTGGNYESGSGEYRGDAGGNYDSGSGEYRSDTSGNYESGSGEYRSDTGGDYSSGSGEYSSDMGGNYDSGSGEYRGDTGGNYDSGSGEYSGDMGGNYTAGSGEYSGDVGGDFGPTASYTGGLDSGDTMFYDQGAGDYYGGDTMFYGPGIDDAYAKDTVFFADGSDTLNQNLFLDDGTFNPDFMPQLMDYYGADSFIFDQPQLPWEVDEPMPDMTTNYQVTGDFGSGYSIRLYGEWDEDYLNPPHPYIELLEGDLDGQRVMLAGVGAVWHSGIIEGGDLFGGYVAADGSAGLLAGTWTGTYSADNTWQSNWISIDRIQMAATGSVAWMDGDPFGEPLAMYYDSSPGRDFSAGAGTIRILNQDGGFIGGIMGSTDKNWGAFRGSINGMSTGAIDSDWHVIFDSEVAGASDVIERYQWSDLFGSQWSGQEIHGKISGAWMNISTAVTGVLGGNLNGFYRPGDLSDSWETIIGGAWMDTHTFLEMAGKVGSSPNLAALDKLKIPRFEIGRTNLTGNNGNLNVTMTDVIFFAYTAGQKPSIWATDNVSGSYSTGPAIGDQVNLGNGGGFSNVAFKVDKWSGGVGGKWAAKVQGSGTISSHAVDIKGGAAGTINSGATFSGKGAGVAR